MNELTRMHYLDAMGIQTFVPRRILTNALAPRRCALPYVEGAGAGAVTVTETTAQLARPVPASEAISGENLRELSDGLNSVLAALGEAPVATTAETTEETTAETKPAAAHIKEHAEPEPGTEHDTRPAVADSDAARYQLALYKVEGLQLIDSQRHGDALPTHALLQAVMKSLLNIASLPSMELQRWPIPGTPQDQQHWSAASELMQDFFESRFAQQSARAFVVMGEDACRLILGKGVDFKGACFTVQQSDTYGLPVLVLPALRDFLYQPELKAKLWRAFKLL